MCVAGDLFAVCPGFHPAFKHSGVSWYLFAKVNHFVATSKTIFISSPRVF
jgi:hypothetical protein